MSVIEKFYGRIDSRELSFCEAEVSARLKTGYGYTNELIEKCKRVLLENTDCRYCAVRVPISCKGNLIDFGYFSTSSNSLEKLLKKCDECFIMAVTLGSKVDLLMKRLEALSVSEHYITDALASALAESAADVAEKNIKKELVCSMRFSAGYGDFRLEDQSAILELLDARKMLGITLSTSYLMTPQKSITAVLGIKK